MSKRTCDTVDTLDTIETLESTPSTPNKKIKKYFSASNLAELHPKIVQCWDYGKNAVGPDQVSMGTNNKFWFTCEKCSHNFMPWIDQGPINENWVTKARMTLNTTSCLIWRYIHVILPLFIKDFDYIKLKFINSIKLY